MSNKCEGILVCLTIQGLLSKVKTILSICPAPTFSVSDLRESDTEYGVAVNNNYYEGFLRTLPTVFALNGLRSYSKEKRKFKGGGRQAAPTTTTAGLIKVK